MQKSYLYICGCWPASTNDSWVHQSETLTPKWRKLLKVFRKPGSWCWWFFYRKTQVKLIGSNICLFYEYTDKSTWLDWEKKRLKLRTHRESEHGRTGRCSYKSNELAFLVIVEAAHKGPVESQCICLLFACYICAKRDIKKSWSEKRWFLRKVVPVLSNSKEYYKVS